MFRSSASLASFEDSNTENEPEPGRARAASVSVSRRARVTRATKSVLADVDAEQDKNRQVTCHVLSPVTLLQCWGFRSVSRKRTAATRSETSVLKEKLLSPVPEGEKSVDSLSATPATKKKRKLYTTSSQHSQVGREE